MTKDSINHYIGIEDKLNALGISESKMREIIIRVVKKVNAQQKKIVEEYRKLK